MPPTVKTVRPLSPHLQVYKPQLTSIMSIFHRATGVWLALGLPLFVIWLAILALPDPAIYRYFITHLQGILGEAAIFTPIFLLMSYGLMLIELPGLQKPPDMVRLLLAIIDILIGLVLSSEIYGYLAAHFSTGIDKLTVPIGMLMLMGWTFAFFYHFWCGIRHLLWDAGYFLAIKAVYATGWTALGLAVVSTALIWAKIFGWTG